MSFLPYDETSSLDRVLAVQASDRELLRTHVAFYRHLMFSSGAVSRRERELLAIAVSLANRCHY